jgi:hypothetical protein
MHVKNVPYTPTDTACLAAWPPPARHEKTDRGQKKKSGLSVVFTSD